jgi:plastocyanin
MLQSSFRACRNVAIVIVAALLAGCGYGSSSSPSPTPAPVPAGATAVNIGAGASSRTTTAYAPSPLTVNVGATVAWTNSDSVAHTSTADGGTWNSGTIAPGATFTRTFTSAGSFTYRCTIHPGMVGTITVQ